MNEDKINDMSYIFFQDVLEALGKKLNFESISNMYGKTVFDKKGGEAINKMIAQANPLTKPNATGNSAQTLLSMPGRTSIIKKDSNNEKMKDFLEGMDWILDAK